MPSKYSLIVSTIGRAPELHELLASLAAQTCQDFEVIVVDQSGGEAVAPVVAEFAARISIRRLPMQQRGASRGRNFGWAQATGEILNFPDDDCTWPPDLLERLERAWSSQPHADAMVTRVETMGRMDAVAGPVTRENLFGRCVEFAIFFRREPLGTLRFDEALGVGAGTPWGADEGPDLLLRMLERGLRIEYCAELCLFHPDPHNQPPDKLLPRTLSYSRGRGYLLRKHRYSIFAVLQTLLRSLGGAAWMLATGRWALARLHLVAYWGKLTGYLNAGRPPAPAQRVPLAGGEAP